MKLTIYIPEATPSQNTYQRWHWRTRMKHLDALRLYVRSTMGAQRRRAQKKHVTIRRYSSGKLDRGNFIGGCKALLDALRHEGVIYDDTEEWLEDRYEQHPAKRGEARTEVEITEEPST